MRHGENIESHRNPEFRVELEQTGAFSKGATGCRVGGEAFIHYPILAGDEAVEPFEVKSPC